MKLEKLLNEFYDKISEKDFNSSMSRDLMNLHFKKIPVSYSSLESYELDIDKKYRSLMDLKKKIIKSRNKTYIEEKRNEIDQKDKNFLFDSLKILIESKARIYLNEKKTLYSSYNSGTFSNKYFDENKSNRFKKIFFSIFNPQK